MFARIPADVVWSCILPRCCIDVRVALGVPPRKLDMAPYLHVVNRRRVTVTAMIVRVRFTLPSDRGMCITYEYDTSRSMQVPGGIFVHVLTDGHTEARFWITAEGRTLHASPPRKVDTSVDAVEFDLSTLPRDAKIVVLGKRSTGKTTLAMDIVRGRDVSLVVSERNHRSGHMPFERFANVRQDLPPEGPGPGVVVLEDNVCTIRLNRNARFHELMFDPELMVVMCMQYPMKHSDRFDYIFAFHEERSSGRDRLWTTFMKDRFESREDFEAAFDRCAPGRHDCMVVADGRLGTYRAPRLRFGEGESIEVWDSDEPGPP
jgi:hypothetical protein